MKEIIWYRLFLFFFTFLLYSDIIMGKKRGVIMRMMNMSEKRFDNLEPLILPNHVYNTEAKLFVLEEKNKWKKRKYVLKKLFNDSGRLFSNKLYTINELIDKSDEISIPELVLPDRLVSIYGNIVGFTMPYIENINLQTILNSYEYSNEQKIGYFKEIGEILEHMKKIRDYTSVTEFYLNDLHENNFILNKETGKINVVDLDSCKIGFNSAFAARYLNSKSPVNVVSKYRKVSSAIYNDYRILPDENTDLYCYIIIILNYLYGGNVSDLSMPEFYGYLSYLHELGVSYELIDKIALVYTEKDNENIYPYLDEFVGVIGRSHHNVYKLVRKK